MELDHEFTVPVPVEQAWPVLLDVERVAPCMPGATLDSIEGDDFTGRLKVKVGPVTVTYRGTAGFTQKDEQAHRVTIEGSGKEARGSGTASATVEAQLHDEGQSTRVTVNTNLQVTGRPAQFGRNVMSEVGTKLIGKFADCLASELAGPEQEATSSAASATGGAGATAESSTAGTATAGAATAPAAASTAAGPDTQPAAATSPNGSGAATTDGQHGQQGTHTGAHAEAPPHPRPSPTPSDTEGEALNLFDIAGGPVLRRALPAVGGLVALLGIVLAIRRKRRR